MLSTLIGYREDALAAVKSWLKDEFVLSGSGFFSNWETIEENAKDNNILFLKSNAGIVGFATWTSYDEVVIIEIVEIKQGYRRKGHGEYLVECLLEELSEQGHLVCHLVCSPPSSINFWKKQGFKNYEVQNTTLTQKYKYLQFQELITHTAIEYKKMTHKLIVKFWSDEEKYKKGFAEKSKCEILIPEEIQEFDPIFVIPSHFDWFIHLIIDEGGVLYSGQVKNCNLVSYVKGFAVFRKNDFEVLLNSKIL